MMMMMVLTVLVLLCSSYVIVSKKVLTRPATAQQHHWSLLHHPANETTTDEATVSSFIRLTFAVKQQNIDLLDDKLLSVSSTNSKHYGQLLSLKEVQELTDPKPVHMDAVMDFLASHGIDRSDTESSSGFIRTTVTFEQAEKILSTKYYNYRHTFTGRIVKRCDQYELPDTIADILDFVSPTIDFPASIRIKTEQQQQQQSLQATTTTTTTTTQDEHQQVHNNNPSSLRSLYFVGDDVVGGKSGASQAVTAFLEQYYSEKDLQKFYTQYYPSLVGTPMSKVVGPNKAPAGIEASLDVEYMTTVGAGVPTEFWSFAGRQPNSTENEPFLDFLYTLGNTTNPPLVFSTSYGEDEDSVLLEYAVRMNQEFAKNALRGITFLLASGDSGVGSCFGSCTTFTPQYPSDSPYVTAVGATTGANPETGAGLSSGGFSNRWSLPSWQKSAVSTYLGTATGLPAAQLYNASGRAFPDVSAQGTNYVVINNGVSYPAVAGTSCSSPTFGGIIGLLNDARLSQGKSPLGFLNPLIYEHPEVFTDITAGNNPGCGTQGFQASKGWDPVTGYGTPNYGKMLALALSLP